MRWVFKPEVTDPTLHNKGCWVLNILYQLIHVVYSLGVEGFTLISSDCSSAEAELLASVGSNHEQDSSEHSSATP